ncbi:MAG: LysR family transcriptional regulator [Hyphomicrobiales bacterium]
MKSSLGFDLRSLEAFVLACKSGSMAAAAKRLHMTQPAVSQIIKGLEASLSSPLVDRSRRPLSLTSSGALLRDAAEQILTAAQRIPSRLRELEGGMPTRLRIGLVDSLACPFVPDLLSSLQGSIESLSVSAGLANNLRNGFAEHRHDIVLTNDSMEDVDGVVRHALLSEPYLLLLPTSLAGQAEASDLRALARASSLVRWSSQSQIGAEIERHLRRLGVEIPRRFEFDSSDTLTGIVAAGLGWAIMTPLCLLNSIARLGTARPAAFPGPHFSRRIYLISRAGELDRVSLRIARLSRRILKEKYLPGMLRVAPWLRGQIIVGNPKMAD